MQINQHQAQLAYDEFNRRALVTYFTEQQNPITTLAEASKPGLLTALLEVFSAPRAVVERLSDSTLITIMRYDIAVTLDELGGTQNAHAVALRALVTHIDAGRMSGWHWYSDSGEGCVIGVLEIALRGQGIHRYGNVMSAIRNRAYDRLGAPFLPVETILLTLFPYESGSPYAQRVFRLLRDAATELLAEREAAR